MVKLAARTPNGASILMTESEFEDFWDLLDARRRVAAHQPSPGQSSAPRSPNDPTSASRHAHGGEWAQGDGRMRPQKTHRCGTCKGCTSSDCGLCKNCRDKPRFGGPGIKKKACLRRICLKARNGDESDDEAQLDEECATSPAHLAVPGEQPPHTTLPSQVGQGSSSSSAITSEPQSEATSPALRPSSPCEAMPSTSLPNGVKEEERSPLEDTSNSQHTHAGDHSQLDVLSRMAMQAMQAR